MQKLSFVKNLSFVLSLCLLRSICPSVDRSVKKAAAVHRPGPPPPKTSRCFLSDCISSFFLFFYYCRDAENCNPPCRKLQSPMQRTASPHAEACIPLPGDFTVFHRLSTTFPQDFHRVLHRPGGKEKGERYCELWTQSLQLRRPRFIFRFQVRPRPTAPP